MDGTLVCPLVETPLAEEDANQFIDVDVRPTKSTYSDAEIWQLLSALSGASNATQFQALPHPQQKLHLFAAYEEGIGPRTLSSHRRSILHSSKGDTRGRALWQHGM